MFKSLPTPLPYFCAALLCFTTMHAKEGLGIHIAPSYEYYNYTEPSVMSIKGQIKGVNMSVSYGLEEHRHSLKGGIYSGYNTYYGSKCNIAAPDACQSLVADSGNTYYLVEYMGQWLMTMDENPKFWLNGGLGYRLLSNDTDDASAYKRKQSYIYAFLGLSVEHSLYKNTIFYANGYGRMLIRGYNTSYMTDLGFDKNLDFTQKKGFGAAIEIGVKHRMAYADFGIEGYVDYWQIGESSTAQGSMGGVDIGTYIEPRNYTIAVGGRIIFGL